MCVQLFLENVCMSKMSKTKIDMITWKKRVINVNKQKWFQNLKKMSFSQEVFPIGREGNINNKFDWYPKWAYKLWVL